MKRNLLLLSIVILAFTGDLNAQWTQSGIPTREVNSLIVNGTDIFAGCDSFVYISSDNGFSWNPVTTGLPGAMGALSLVAGGVVIFALSNDPVAGVYASVNNGGNWLSTGGSSPIALYGNRLVLRGSTLYGIGSNGVMRTNLAVPSWMTYNAGLPHTCNLAFGGSGEGLFIYIDDDGTCLPPAVGAFRTTSASSTWSPVTGLPVILSYPTPWAMASNSTKIFAGGQGTVYVTTDTGASWTPLNTATFDVITTLAVSGNVILAGHAGAGIYVSIDTGHTWLSANTGLTIGSPNADIRSLIIDGTDVYAGTAGAGVWKRELSNIITAVKEANADYQLSVYPNPAKDKFMLSLQSSTDLKVKISITNAIGELVFISEEDHVSGKYLKEIKLANAAGGVYFATISMNDRVITKKLVINR